MTGFNSNRKLQPGRRNGDLFNQSIIHSINHSILTSNSRNALQTMQLHFAADYCKMPTCSRLLLSASPIFYAVFDEIKRNGLSRLLLWQAGRASMCYSRWELPENGGTSSCTHLAWYEGITQFQRRPNQVFISSFANCRYCKLRHFCLLSHQRFVYASIIFRQILILYNLNLVSFIHTNTAAARGGGHHHVFEIVNKDRSLHMLQAQNAERSN